MENTRQFRIAAFIATAYILAAFAWWSMLLLRKNNEAMQARSSLLRLELQQKGMFLDDAQFQLTPQYSTEKTHFDKQSRMVLGEGSVLFIGLLIGVWAIHRSFRKEIELSTRQRNFLLSVSHELKSPIASIQLVVQTLQKRQLDAEKQNKLLHSASVESERLNVLVNNLLLSSRLDDAFEPQDEEVNITRLLEDLVEKCRMKFPKATFKFHKNDVPILRGDRQALVSIFTNLLENAVKYSGEKPNIELRQQFDNERFMFEIADNGDGIPQNERRRVFEKFYRVGSEMTRKTKGTGLGLFIVAQLVKLHKGSIQIADNTPRGTIFRIILPN